MNAIKLLLANSDIHKFFLNTTSVTVNGVYFEKDDYIFMKKLAAAQT